MEYRLESAVEANIAHLSFNESDVRNVASYRDLVALETKQWNALVAEGHDFTSMRVSTPESLNSWLMPRSKSEDAAFVQLRATEAIDWSREQILNWRAETLPQLLEVASQPTPASPAKGLGPLGAAGLALAALSRRSLKDVVADDEPTVNRRVLLGRAIAASLVGGLALSTGASAAGCDCYGGWGTCGAYCLNCKYNLKMDGKDRSIFYTYCTSYCTREIAYCRTGCGFWC